MKLRKNVLAGVALLATGVLFGGMMVSGFGWVNPSMADVRLGASEAPVTADAAATSFSQAFVEVAEKVTPAIVHIRADAKVEDPHKDFFFPFESPNMPDKQRGFGSGIVISEDGYILTNNHVVENATDVEVTLSDERKFDAKIVGTDPLTDIAVVKINASGLKPAYLGDSGGLKVGQWVMAIGNPLSLTSTVTSGIISALDRPLNLIDDSYGIENFIQTDAVINPGNSGGALVDLSGAVIGVNTAIASRTGTYIGYGFAIPINMARTVAKDLIAHGKITRGYIGVQIRNVDNAMAKALGLDKPQGVIVETIVPDGAAADTELKEGDVILKIDERKINKANQLQGYVATKLAGDVVTLTVFRDGERFTVDVELKAIDEEAEAEKGEEVVEEEEEEASVEETFDHLGMTVRNLTAKERDEYKVKNGVMITNVESFSVARDHGLFANLVVSKAGDEEVESVERFQEIIEYHRGDAVLLVVVDRRGTSRFVGLEIPE
ncbi:MAG: Do family serine endopeptidase [Ignavibacteriales bacterium]|nr:Do family serine endopeptidase [Ignavibacteriales bacterium]